MWGGGEPARCQRGYAKHMIGRRRDHSSGHYQVSKAPIGGLTARKRTQGLEQGAQELGAAPAVVAVGGVARHRRHRHELPQRPLQLLQTSRLV